LKLNVQNVDFSTNLAFDLSVTTVLYPLCYGLTIFPYKHDLLNVSLYIKHLLSNKIELIKSTPNYLASISSLLGGIFSIKVCIVGGEKLDLGLVKHILNFSSSVIDEYGPTETTVGVMSYLINKATTVLTLGKCYANYTAYILDNNLVPLPLGAIGELYVGGAGVARGYLNNEGLTKERFIANPFQSDEENVLGVNSRIYKTGDLVRYLPDGNIEYIGRNDFQVKIRGYRIELGEIESKLTEYPEIKQAVVLAKEHKNISGKNSSNSATTSNKYLVAYYVSKGKLDEEAILAYLANELPEYMVPSILMRLDRLPLTINGKLDRKALPDPEFISSNSYVAPRNKLESKVCGIYAEVLGLAEGHVGIKDDFFRLGGDSIVSIQLVSRLRQRLGLQVSVKDVFSNKTVEKLYSNVLESQLANLDSANLDAMTIRESGILSNSVELLPIQEWLFNKIELGLYTKPAHWNQSFLVRANNLDQDLLKLSIAKLIEYHDAFRLVYKCNNDQDNSASSSIKQCYQQYYQDISNVSTANLANSIKLNYLNLTSLDVNEDSCSTKLATILTNWQDKFNLEDESPLYSIGYIDGYSDGTSRVFFALHHLLVDAVSWRIIAHDLGEIYTKLAKAQESNQLENIIKQNTEELLGKKGTSYRQWIGIVNGYANDHKEEVDYWLGQTSSASIQAYNQQLAKLVESEDTQNYAQLVLDKEITNKLLTQSNQAYHTEINDLLLSAFSLSLFELLANNSKDNSTNSNANILDSHYICLEGHGREELMVHQDITRTVGWFTSMYPIKLPVSSDLHSTIINIKESLRFIPNKGIGYGSIYGYIQHELPRISFNYLGQFDSSQDKESSLLWQVVGESSGISMSELNHDSNIINVNGLVSNGVLSFGISSKLDHASLDKLTSSFKDKLTELVEYASNSSRSYLTVSDINNVISQSYLDTIQRDKEVSGVYLANNLQQGFIYHALNQGAEDTAYRVQLIFDYTNELEVELLKAAWQRGVNKYPSLRLRFAWEDNLVQIIDKHQDLEWHYYDISNLVETQDIAKLSTSVDNLFSKQELFINNLVHEDRARNYDLSCGNLLRVYLIKQSSNKYSCILSSHHTILDGWSTSRLMGYIHESYLVLLSNKQQYLTNSTKLAEYVLQVDEEHAYLASQKYLQESHGLAESYWNGELALIEDYPDLGGLLKVDKKHIDLYEYKRLEDRQEYSTSLQGRTYAQLKETSQSLGVSINAILQYAWHKLQSTYGNSKTSIVGMTISGRNLPIDDIEESVGLYINTLPLIINHGDKEGDLADALISLQDKINNINSHSNISLAKLQQDGRRLFNTLFIYENYPISKSENNQLNLSFKQAIEELDYPLGVIAYEQSGKIVINLKYAGELFTHETIESHINTYCCILEQIANGLDKQDNKLINIPIKIKELNYLSQTEYSQLIYTWNDTRENYPQDKTIHQLFEEQVERTPTNIAVVYEGIRLTYRELNARANQLSNYLRATYDIQGDDLIALCLDRSELMLIALLGVLKSGAAYVPMDPSYPNDRVEYILQDTQTKVVLINEGYETKLNKILQTLDKHQVIPTIELIDSRSFRETLSSYPDTNPEQRITSNNLAYVIYTSGTTGKPKGVMVEHRSVAAFILGFINDPLSESKGLNMLSTTNYVFDIFGLEYLLPLVNGYYLELNSLINPKFAINLKCYDCIQITPSKLELLINHINIDAIEMNIDSYEPIKITILVGGEAITQSVIKQVSELQRKLVVNNLDINFELINVYGPTEATIWSTASKLDIDYTSGKLNNQQVTIGRPLSGETVYVLTPNLVPLPVGAIGELYIGGIGLARGYLNLPNLTAETFIANPFQTRDEKASAWNGRLYKTGDLVRYLVDGNIEYLGRNDSQVKIRGFRIELGEIESKLSTYPQIKQVVVLAREHKNSQGTESDNKYLVGYYVADNKLDEDAVLSYLAEHLPEYMIPSLLVYLEQLPLTINGKLDRKILPDPEFKSLTSYIAPRNDLESKICGIYAEVLGLEVNLVGLYDDFFKLGGNSILVIRLISKINNLCDLKLNLKIIFKHKCPAELCEFIDSQVSDLIIEDVWEFQNV
jgi:amino acid adenylation domain-containing protein/non-ribosomal peptide synthase protein (TIGR01720 family)